jgi:hypothetical protein
MAGPLSGKQREPLVGKESHMKKERLLFVSLGSLLLLFVITSQAWAQSFVLSKVVDTNTPIPGGSGNFNYFLPMAISGDNVAFEGEGSSGQHGIYLFNGTTLIKVADFSTPIPSGSGNFHLGRWPGDQWW